ncbi:MAG: EAL domain-containing protein [Alphaproteobacteria bacterium]|nr:EAL domain-containing protein [Alphaproteobacteria bacterium]
MTFDYIKIDRAFVEAVGKDRKRLKIVKSIIALANGLDIPTTAEGIERPEQLAQLKSLDCKFGQGYLFARPMTFTEASGFLQNAAAPEGSPR